MAAASFDPMEVRMTMLSPAVEAEVDRLHGGQGAIGEDDPPDRRGREQV
ncbi:unnamed protein product [[Actinomadura] parvosata subsp. kistnae]|nr:hypothetical protein [Nonomuraea sp. ATCC 55076]SPL98797.1 unnamed protein product [Actinomadura parvosata subsp. kistnae]